jgi:hypothetical protein
MMGKINWLEVARMEKEEQGKTGANFTRVAKLHLTNM